MRVAFGTILLGAILSGASALAQPPAGKSTKDPAPPEKVVWPKVVNGKTLPLWQEALATSIDPSMRSRAIMAIVQFGEPAAQTVPLILRRLDDKDVSPRAKALTALGMMSVNDEDIRKVVEAVSARLDPKREHQAVIRIEAVRTLARFHKDLSPAIPGLVLAAKDPDSWEIRHLAIALLWRYAAETKAEDTRITEALLLPLGDTRPGSARAQDSANAVRLEAVMGLAALGLPSNPSLQQRVFTALDSAARSRNKPIAIWGNVGLVSLHKENTESSNQALGSLGRLLNKDNPLETRVQAASALGALGNKAKSRLPLLRAMLKDKEPSAVHAACTSIRQIGDKSTNTLNALIELANHKDPVRAAAGVIALVQMWPKEPRVTDTFNKMLDKKDIDNNLRGLVLAGLKELKKPPKERP